MMAGRKRWLESIFACALVLPACSGGGKQRGQSGEEAAPGEAADSALAKCAKGLEAAAPPDFGLEAVRACGEEHYGLAEERAGFLSPAWFVAHRVGRWLEREREGAEGAVAARIDAALAEGIEVELPVPLRLPDIVRLPGGERRDPLLRAASVLSAPEPDRSGA